MPTAGKGTGRKVWGEAEGLWELELVDRARTASRSVAVRLGATGL